MSHIQKYRPSPAMIIATIALFVAAGGTGIAATKLLTGAQIKDGSLTGKDIKNNSIGLGKLSGTLPAGPVGLAGPKGDAGPAGVPGVAGSARAYGMVIGTTATRSKGVVSVTNPSAGIFCLTLDPSIAIATVGLVATPEFTNDDTGIGVGGDQAFVEWRSAAPDCPGVLEVLTGVRTVTGNAPVTAVDNLLANESFFFMVP